VMAEATPRIGAQWLASQGSFACGEAQDDMSSIGETLWMQHCSQIIDLIQRHYRGGNTVRGKLEGRLATWLQVQVPSSISTPSWSRDQAQDLWPSSCPAFVPASNPISRSTSRIYSKSDHIPDPSVHAWIIPLTFLLGSSMSHSAILRNARCSTDGTWRQITGPPGKPLQCSHCRRES
jgi:hypothetical protein